MSDGDLKKWTEISSQKQIIGAQRNVNLLPSHIGVVDAYQHLAPVIDTDRYMMWLRSLITDKGAQFVTAFIDGDLFSQEAALLTQFDAQVIVNATGLGASELAADDAVYPLRGALIRVVNDGTKFPIVTEALAVGHDDSRSEDDEDIVFIVPRNETVLVLGGIAQSNKHELDLTLDSPEVKRMRERCNRYIPGLAEAEYDTEASLVQGLRPFRAGNVRVERETQLREDGSMSRIVHSYGQGGAGFSLSFGCAHDVLSLIDELEKEVPPKKMSARL